MFPPEIHLKILEFALEDKTLYKDSQHPDSLSVSSWIGLSLVCRAWKTCVYSIAFDHLFVDQKHLSTLHNLGTESLNWDRLEHTPRPALSFISTLTISFRQPNLDFSKTLMILESASNLDNLSLDICLRDDTAAIDLTRTPNLGQVKCFSLRFVYVPDALHLPWKTKDVQWIISCMPSATHLLLDLPARLCSVDASCQAPFPLPQIVSIQSNHWVEWLLGPDADFPNLRFLEVSGDPSNDNYTFLDRHATRIESLSLADVSHGWANLIPRFQPLQHLALSHLHNFPWRSVHLPNLMHFEFIWIGRQEEAVFPDIVDFVKRNNSLEGITYHSEFMLSFLEVPCRFRGIGRVFRQRAFHQDWRSVKFNQGKLLYAIPYTEWIDIAMFFPPLPPMTVPKSLNNN